jgi:BT1 family
MFFFQTNSLHFSAGFLGHVRLVGSFASLAGVAAYNVWLKDVPLRRMFLWTALLGAGLGMTQLLLITGAGILLLATK